MTFAGVSFQFPSLSEEAELSRRSKEFLTMTSLSKGRGTLQGKNGLLQPLQNCIENNREKGIMERERSKDDCGC